MDNTDIIMYLDKIVALNEHNQKGSVDKDKESWCTFVANIGTKEVR